MPENKIYNYKDYTKFLDDRIIQKRMKELNFAKIRLQPHNLTKNPTILQYPTKYHAIKWLIIQNNDVLLGFLYNFPFFTIFLYNQIKIHS